MTTLKGVWDWVAVTWRNRWADGDSALTGLRVGDHVCLPRPARRRACHAVAAFVAGGLQDHQRVLIFDEAPSGLVAVLVARVRGCAAALARGQVVVSRVRQAYLPDGVFDPDRLLRQLIQAVDTAVADGYTGLRVSGDLSQAASLGVDAATLLAYESAANTLFTRYPLVALCHYDPDTVGSELWWRLTRTHPATVTDRQALGSHRLRCRRTADGLRLTGVADLTNHAALPGLLAAIVDHAGPLLVDATGLRVVDPIGAGALLRAVVARDGQSTTVVASPALHTMLRLLGADDQPGLRVVVGS